MRSFCSLHVTFLAAAIATTACGPNPEAVLESYVAAHNAHDVEGALEYFAENPVFELPGGDVRLEGIAAIRDLESWDATVQSHIEMSEIVRDGQTLIVNRIIERNLWFQSVGIEEVTYTRGTRITIIKGRITSIRAADLSPESIAAITSVMSEFMPWANMNHPRQIGRLVPNGKFIYNAEAAKGWLRLLKEWQARQE